MPADTGGQEAGETPAATESADAADEAPEDVEPPEPATESVESIAEEATPLAAVEADPPKEVVVCLDGEISDLFLYGDASPAALAVRHALHENLVTSSGYAYEAQGLRKLPSLADGDAQRIQVTVREGDRVVDVNGNVVSLRKGVVVSDASGEDVAYVDEPLEMEQLAVDFSFNPMVWSDGTPVSAVDSVFSFNVAADPQSSADRGKTGLTESYEATDDLSVRWRGLPGFLDMTYFTNVWTPLPSHVLGRYTAVELHDLEEATSSPLSSGPYVVETWESEKVLKLSANPHYYRGDEGLPRIDRVTILTGSIEEFLAAEAPCDVIAGGTLGAHNLPVLAADGALDGWEVITAPGNVYEQIAFGINPRSDYAADQPDWFGDARVRQAIALCTDRERMIDEVNTGEGVLMNTLTPDEHPLTPPGLTAWSYDPDGANALLDEAGFLDHAGDGRRQDVTSGVPMTITLGTNSESALRLRITQIFQENMAACGIPVALYERPAGTWFEAGPAGPLFGRRFDLASFAWLGRVIPDCAMFTSDNVPGPQEDGFGGWDAPNVSGWSDEAYDAACRTAVHALPGGEGYEAQMEEALRIFNEQLPALPLFTNYVATAVRPGIVNVRPDAVQPSVLWNIAEWDVVE